MNQGSVLQREGDRWSVDNALAISWALVRRRTSVLSRRQGPARYCIAPLAGSGESGSADPARHFTSWRSAVASMCILMVAVGLVVLDLAWPLFQ